MVAKPVLQDGEYPFISRRLPLSDLAWIEAPATLEALLREQARANNIQLVRGRPVELRCVTPQYGDAVFMVFWPDDDEHLHMLAPKAYQKGRA